MPSRCLSWSQNIMKIGIGFVLGLTMALIFSFQRATPPVPEPPPTFKLIAIPTTDNDKTIFNRSTNTNMLYTVSSRGDDIQLFPKSKTNECVEGEREIGLPSVQVSAQCYELWERTPSTIEYLSGVYGSGGLFGPLHVTSLLSKADVLALDFILSKHQKIENIVEFGTARGWNAYYFAAVARMRGGRVSTVDCVKCDSRDEKVKRAWLPNMEFVQVDLLGARESDCPRESKKQQDLKCTPCSHRVPQLVRDCDFLFIDNGDKMREAALYARYARVGAVVAVHDHCGPWGEGYESIFPKLGYTPKYGDLFASLGSCVRSWVREIDTDSHLKLPVELEDMTKDCFGIGYLD